MKKIIDITNKSNMEKLKSFFKIGDFGKAFDPGYDAANRFFDVQEKLIRMQRRSETDRQEQIIKNAEEQIKSAQNIIDTNQYQISRYEDGLKTIDDQANSINERYEKQFESLDKINRINEVIARQEQGRLSVAQALSQGDIFAAARAMQEYRAQSAQEAIAQQRTGMEANRDAEIGQLTANGLTRDQLEQKINTLKQQNYRIEQDTIAPLQEQARLAQVQLDAINKQIEKQVEGLTIAGMTKQQWDDQKVKIDAAELASGKYNEALKNSLETIKHINSMWDSVLAKLAQYSGFDIPGAPSAGGDTTTTTTTTTPTPSTTSSGGIKSSAITTKPSTSTSIINKKFPTVTSANIMGSGSGFGISYSSNKIMGGGKTLPPQTWQQAVAKAIPKKWNMGGKVQRFATGGFAMGTDIVPAMLTPGEFIISKFAVDRFGVDNLRAINKGENPVSSSVYNYNLSVNVKSDANPNEIANTVMMKIKQIDSQRIKGNRI